MFNEFNDQDNQRDYSPAFKSPVVDQVEHDSRDWTPANCSI